MSIATEEQAPPLAPDTDPQQGVDRLFAQLGTRQSGLSDLRFTQFAAGVSPLPLRHVHLQFFVRSSSSEVLSSEF